MKANKYNQASQPGKEDTEILILFNGFGFLDVRCLQSLIVGQKI